MLDLTGHGMKSTAQKDTNKPVHVLIYIAYKSQLSAVFSLIQDDYMLCKKFNMLGSVKHVLTLVDQRGLFAICITCTDLKKTYVYASITNGRLFIIPQSKSWRHIVKSPQPHTVEVSYPKHIWFTFGNKCKITISPWMK